MLYARRTNVSSVACERSCVYLNICMFWRYATNNMRRIFRQICTDAKEERWRINIILFNLSYSGWLLGVRMERMDPMLCDVWIWRPVPIQERYPREAGRWSELSPPDWSKALWRRQFVRSYGLFWLVEILKGLLQKVKFYTRSIIYRE
jgi:hypothetical protein